MIRLALVLAAAAFVVGCGSSDRGTLRLHRLPYVGLACRQARRNPCTRVGLAVWVPRPATSVSADLHGHTLILVTGPGGSGEYAAGRFWQAFFSDPSVARLADASQRVRVDVRARLVSGEVRTAAASVPVSQGYG